ncbi:MAG: hypothetical protein LAO76_18985 [Acidobacteriia bacterium]|nr:hypothetical protein [Terriglobia bacterium]
MANFIGFLAANVLAPKLTTSSAKSAMTMGLACSTPLLDNCRSAHLQAL